jgi:hypothetical protein
MSLVTLLLSLFLLRPPSIAGDAGWSTNWSATTWGQHGSWPRHVAIALLMIEIGRHLSSPQIGHPDTQPDPEGVQLTLMPGRISQNDSK